MKSLFNVLLISTLAIGPFVTALEDLATDSSVAEQDHLHAELNAPPPVLPVMAANTNEEFRRNKQDKCDNYVYRACESGECDCIEKCESTLQPCKNTCGAAEDTCRHLCTTTKDINCGPHCSNEQNACEVRCKSLGGTDPNCANVCKLGFDDCNLTCTGVELACSKACETCGTACDSACQVSETACRASCESGEHSCRYKSDYQSGYQSDYKPE